MNYRSNVWNFDETNTEKRFSLFTKAIVVGFVIAFLVVPLSTISPETFVIPESAGGFFIGFCPCLGCY